MGILYLTDAELGSLKNIYSPITDYNGNLISDPHIMNAQSATILWQDADNLISSVSLSSDKKWLMLKVENNNITQGNAVIAVSDKENNIIWSWHIWVTDLDIKYADNQIKIGNYTFLCDNIGWCDGKSRMYMEKKYELSLIQNFSNKTINHTFIQRADTISQKGNSTYYQWGRKDPFPGMSDYDKRKVTYNGSVSVYPDFIGNGYGYGTAEMIKNPSVFYSFSAKCWFYYDDTAMNHKIPWIAWNTKAFDVTKKFNQYDDSRKESTKSIYDPCPIGYKVPPVGAYSEIRTLFSWDSNIMAYKVSNANKIVYFYALGYLVANRDNGDVGELWKAGSKNREQLRYWTTEVNGTEAEHLCHKIGADNVHAENSFLSQGFPIKAVVDESVIVK